MKKSIFAVIFSVFLFSLSAQNSYQVANKNTAVRCLKLAENCLMSRDWNNALKQAELGLSYDDSISDLIYIKAAALMNMNSKKADVLGQINKAFELDNWVNNKKNGARILYADLLSDTGKYEDSICELCKLNGHCINTPSGITCEGNWCDESSDEFAYENNIEITN